MLTVLVGCGLVLVLLFNELVYTVSNALSNGYRGDYTI